MSTTPKRNWIASWPRLSRSSDGHGHRFPLEEESEHLHRPAGRRRDRRCELGALPAASKNVVFERALIHHLKDYKACFAEAHRVQDCTPDDVKLPGSAEHVRGYFFERFPRLLAVELARRPTDAAVRDALQAAGFRDINSITLWELRKT